MSHLFCSVPNKGKSPNEAFASLRRAGDSGVTTSISRVEMPSLVVGTLDSLLVLSSSVGKTDSSVESVLRRIEKCYNEMKARNGRNGNNNNSSNSGWDSELTISGGMLPERYLEQFQWEYSKYPHRRPLKDLTALITSGISTIEEELKTLTTQFAEKSASLADLRRKKGGNFMTADLADVLDEITVSSMTILDTEHLKTVFIAVPRSGKRNLEESYEEIGDKIVGYGGPDWLGKDKRRLGTDVAFGHLVDRHAKRGSPVVPGSLQIVKDDGESALYSLVILKGQYEAGYYEADEFQAGQLVDFEKEFERAVRDKGMILRPFDYNPDNCGLSTRRIEDLQIECEQLKSGLTRWCRSNYGEVFVAWTHLKIIRVFVESVLRYGLPVDMSCALYLPAKGKESALHANLASLFIELDGAGMDGDSGEKVEGEEVYYPYVVIDLSIQA